MELYQDVTTRNKLLDNFPVSEEELQCILLYFQYSRQDDNDDDNEVQSLSQLCRLVGEQRQAQQLETNHNDNDATDTTWWMALQDVEQRILPNVLSTFQSATNYVSPLLPYDIVPDEESSSSLSLYQAFYFLEAMVSLLGRRGTRFLPSYVFDSLQQQQQQQDINDDTGIGTVDATALVNGIHRQIQAAHCLQNFQTNHDGSKLSTISLETPMPWIESLQNAANKSNSNKDNTSGGISRVVWTDWLTNTLPEAMRGFTTFYHLILFSPQHPFGTTSPPPLQLPQSHPDNLFWNSSSDINALSLGCMSSVFCSRWHRLYSSSQDGLSFMTFQTALLGYSGPTVLLIRKKGGNGCFGFYTDCPWKESNAWFGGDGHDSFLFKIDKSFSIYWPTYDDSLGKYNMYLDASSPTAMGYSKRNQLRGLAIGGIAEDTPRIHLTLSLENCKATSTDTTYTSGPLFDADDADGMVSPFFDIDALEVWAVNVTDEEFHSNKKAGQKHVAIKENTRQRAAQVDRTQFLDDFKSGAVLNKLFDHREEARGRHDFVAASTEGSGYFLESKPPSRRVLPRYESSDAGTEQSTEETSNANGKAS